jgi:hypothetical protein
MNKTQILVVGYNEAILQKILEEINNNSNLEAIGTTDDEKSIELFHHRSFDLVILGDGLTEVIVNRLKKLFTLQNPHVSIIIHIGTDSGSLMEEVSAILQKVRENDLHVIDNPFQ